MQDSRLGLMAQVSWAKNLAVEPYLATAAAAKSLQSCPTVRPHRRQPTRLPCPWDSPGKNTGVGCHFLLQCMKVKSESEVAESCPTLSDPMACSLPGSSVHGIFQVRALEWGAIVFCNISHSCFQMLVWNFKILIISESGCVDCFVSWWWRWFGR